MVRPTIAIARRAVAVSAMAGLLLVGGGDIAHAATESGQTSCSATRSVLVKSRTNGQTGVAVGYNGHYTTRTYYNTSWTTNYTYTQYTVALWEVNAPSIDNANTFGSCY